MMLNVRLFFSHARVTQILELSGARVMDLSKDFNQRQSHEFDLLSKAVKVFIALVRPIANIFVSKKRPLRKWLMRK